MSKTVTPASGLVDEMRDTAMMQEDQEEDSDDVGLDLQEELEEEQSEEDMRQQAEQARRAREQRFQQQSGRGRGRGRGRVGGHWVMGTPYKQVASLSYLPPTIVYGAYSNKVYEQIKPTKMALNESVVSTPAECATLVHRDHREATAAEYSNVGGEWCFAVFEATGVIFDPMIQTCVFEVE